MKFRQQTIYLSGFASHIKSKVIRIQKKIASLGINTHYIVIIKETIHQEH